MIRTLVLLLCLSVTLLAEPRRIVSTGPGITEILFALGLGDRVIAATQYCVYPEEAKKLPRIGSWTNLNMEAILSLRPDLVVVQKTAVSANDRFQSLKLKTVEIELQSVSDIHAAIEAIGKATGAQAAATKLNASIRSQLDEIRKAVGNRPQVSTLFIVGRTPGTVDGLITVGKTSYQGQVLELAGGQNVFGDINLGYSKISHEALLSRDPAVIVDMGEHAEAGGLTDAQRKAQIVLWGRFSKLAAVRNGKVFPVSSPIYVVPGPRVVEMAKSFARMLHPEAFR